MTNQPYYLKKAIFMVACLTFGCTGSGMAGCGSDSPADPTVDSQLFGIYAVDSYRSSPADPLTGLPIPDSCDELSDAPPLGAFIVVYSFLPNDAPSHPLLAAVFCNDVTACKDIAKRAPAPTVGYSFVQGNDQSGWVGYGISRTGSSGDQCEADVQTHTLTASGQTINITTETVETVFPPRAVTPGDEATCRNGDALDALEPDLPCKARLSLDATFDSSL